MVKRNKAKLANNSKKNISKKDDAGGDSDNDFEGNSSIFQDMDDNQGSDDDENSSDEASDDEQESYEDESDDGEAKVNEPIDKNKVLFPHETQLSDIKNKERRNLLYRKMKADQVKEKRELRQKRLKEYKALGKSAPPKQVPKTIENMREFDDTLVAPDDEEVKQDEAVDEFASYFRAEREPKILVTTSDYAHSRTLRFCREFMRTVPNSEFKRRKKMSIKRMVVAATERGYTDIIVVNEDRGIPNALLSIHLPNGPTAYFKLSSIKYCKQIRKRSRECNNLRPEVIINNFKTRLGHTMGRMLASWYHYDPEFKGRRVVTFHNQRDYIFFRHHM